MKKSKLLLSLLVTASLGAPAVWAASTEVAPETYTLTGVVIEANRIYSDTVTTRQAAGWLGDRDTMRVPFHTVTVGSTALHDMSIPGRGATDVLSLDPAIRTTPDPYGETPLIIRGIRASGLQGWSVNGIPGMTNQNEMPNNWVDSITVVAGPNFGLNGTSSKESSGGLVNYTSKKAEATPTREVGFTWGPSRYRNFTVDVGQRFGTDQRWGVRLNALAGNGKGSLANSNMTNSDVYLNIDQHTSHSSTNFLIGYNRFEENGGIATIDLSGKAKDGPYYYTKNHLPKVPHGRFDLGTRWEETKAENFIMTLNHEQKFNKYLTGFINAGYHRENMSKWMHAGNEYYYIDNNGNFVGNSMGDYPAAHTTKYIAVGLKGYADLRPNFKNEFVFSVDKNYFTRQQVTQLNGLTIPSGDNPPIIGNMYEPNSSPFNVPFIDMSDYLKTKFKVQVSGIHFLDTITTLNGKLDILAGVTYNKLKQNIRYPQTNDSGKREATHIKQNHTSPIFGLNYRITPEMSVYYSHEEAIGWGGSVNRNYANLGTVQTPVKSKSNEVGFKMKTGNMLNTVSLFRINRDSYISEMRPDNTLPYQVAGGKTRYQGLEISTAGSISKKWDLMAYLDFLSVTQQKGANDKYNGKRFGGIPDFSAGLMATYHPSEQWSIMGRINYMGDTQIRKASAQPSIDVPSFTTVDVGLKYTFGIHKKDDTTLNLMCYNLFNRHYWFAEDKNLINNNISTAQVTRGMERTVILSATYKL